MIIDPFVRKIILVSIIIVFYCFLGHSQTFRGGIKGGLTASQVNGDNYSGYNRLGVTGGVFVRLKYGANQAFQVEMNYVQKGSRHVPDEKDPFDFGIFLQYVEMPYLFFYNYKILRFELGLATGFLINGREKHYDTIVFEDYNFFEISGIIGLSYPLSEKLVFNVRSSNTIPWTPIRPHPSGRTTFFNKGQTNVILEFTLHYTFPHHQDK